MNIREYYNNDIILPKLQNIFSGCDWFLVSGEDYSKDKPPVRVHKIDQLRNQLGNGPDIFMPLTSSKGVLGVFDLEYSHSDKRALYSPQEFNGIPFHDYVFLNYLEPIISSIEFTFGDECITDTTWSGYHILTQLERNSPVYNKLLELGSEKNRFGSPKCLEYKLMQLSSIKDYQDPKREKPIAVNDLIVYEQYGRVLEYLSHEIMRAFHFDKPISICDAKEDCISLDLSQYADPLFMRIIRTPFSSWDKHNMQEPIKSIVGEPKPFLDVVRKWRDFENRNMLHLFYLAKDYESAIEYSKKFDGIIPAAGNNVLRLVETYANSKLFKMHRDFDNAERDVSSDKYRSMENNPQLSEDFKRMFVRPNDELLKPSNLKKLSEHLIEDGWHPKHIAGLIAAFYTHPNKDWKGFWNKYTPETKANFWARIYTSLYLENL